MKNPQESKFLQGALSPALIAQRLTSNTQIGGQAIFLGQVRADEVGNTSVQAIEYSAYPEMAEIEFEKICQSMRTKYTDLLDITMLHSLGVVKTGETSLLVIVSARHRAQAFQAIAETVDLIKARVPIWKKEIMDNNSSRWIK